MMQLKQIIYKIIKNPQFFFNNFLYIQHPIKGRIKFKLYDFQKDTLDKIVNNRFTVILKARQMGISTLVAAYSLWYAMFHKDKNILIIATKLRVAQNIVQKVKIMYDELPDWLRMLYPTVKDNTTEIMWENGSKIKAEAMTEDAGRSEALSLLIIDEAAFIRNIDELWTAVFPTLSTGGRAIVLSTPNGTGNFFHKLYSEAEQGLNNFVPIKLHWTLHPERDEQWMKQTIKDIGIRRFAQEYDCDFLMSGNTFIDIEILNKIEPKEPIEKRGISKDYWIWKYPENQKSYIVSADVSRGDGSDYSTFQILEISELEQVAEFKGKISTNDFARILVTVATEYNNALLIVENTGIGWSVLSKIVEIGYENLYYSNKKMTEVVDPEVFINKNINLEDKFNMIPGFSTTSKTRPLILSKMEMFFREEEIKIYSKRLLEELKVFIWEKGKPQAQKGYNDDLVMALAIGLFVRDTAVIFSDRVKQATKKTLELMEKTLNTPEIYDMKNHNKNPYILENNLHAVWDLRELI